MRSERVFEHHIVAMKHIFPLIFVLGFIVFASRATAMYSIPETEKVPIQRLFTNLQVRIKTNASDIKLTYQLARLHSMAYATNLHQIIVLKESGYPHWRETKFSGLPWVVQDFKSPQAKAVGIAHLTNAVGLYERCLVLMKQSTNVASWEIVDAELGRAWCLDQLGKKDEALAAYRKTLKIAWRMEVTGDFSFKEWVSGVWSDIKSMRNPIRGRDRAPIMVGECYCEEIIGYMKKLLDSKKDAKELADLEKKEEELSKLPRAVTPILVPLGEETSLAELVNPNAGVEFDLDGSGLKRKWGWITPKAAWLVYDSDGSGSITSALQMFGNVTFWIFWQDGYAALAALDDDQNGMLAGAELEHLALWHDKNGNGVSDSGEVLPVTQHGIVAIRTNSKPFSGTIRWNPAGLIMEGGATRPTYDWIAPSN